MGEPGLEGFRVQGAGFAVSLFQRLPLDLTRIPIPIAVIEYPGGSRHLLASCSRG